MQKHCLLLRINSTIQTTVIVVWLETQNMYADLRNLTQKCNPKNKTSVFPLAKIYLNVKFG